ncbi:hypothetical protein [Xylella fastidiosa]|nr:hypothetical protein [Xylella fastidiosa]
MMLEVAVQVLSVRDVFVPGTGCVLERVAAEGVALCAVVRIDLRSF